MSPLDRHGDYFPPDDARPDAGVASAARTVTGTGAAFDVDQADSLDATLTISASAGTTPTLVVSLETSVDGANWHQVGAFASKNTTGEDAQAFGPLGGQARWKWTIAGTTPSFTFAVDVVAKD